MSDPSAHRPFPPPTRTHPVSLPDGSGHPGTVFLSAVIDHPRMVIGDYSYASAFDPPEDWAARLAPYLFDFSPERLHIGKFCQIADGVQFITASANHRHDGISTFPFAIFGGDGFADRPSMPGPGADTHVGHDVWIGQGARILPGVRIGTGAIIAAGAVVTADVAAYTIVGGNPARPLRRRFPEPQSAALLDIAWWDWPVEKILTHEAVIYGGDVTALAAL
ncbi:CatB-related O-acetyltransferase [Sulfitobacter sp. S190]|uniref:CatB-related O-acetyltransferase n=1 Tax=Sulfitobacter sp. S190 TaxID=2867022 RepID=UPI0021A4209B|nr:CatB-related O-acetyltransferase [Sulfitobacter sp. S190]UWR22937.1 CatB-related O-acetyltransferase [Sulfitobacter sp. S190]